jgi:hypothetical protein
MAMAGVEWANVYYWSEQQGSLCARVPRDREYFRLLWQVGSRRRGVVRAACAWKRTGLMGSTGAAGQVWEARGARASAR